MIRFNGIVEKKTDGTLFISPNIDRRADDGESRAFVRSAHNHQIIGMAGLFHRRETFVGMVHVPLRKNL